MVSSPTSPTRSRATLRSLAAIALLGGASACASGASSGLGPPSLTGEYELIGPLAHDDTEPADPIRVVFLPDMMVQTQGAYDLNRPRPPRRYRISGDRVTFSVGGVEIRVELAEEGGYHASARGTYQERGRPYEVCRIWSPVGDDGTRRCMQQVTQYRQVTRNYERPVIFRRPSSSG